MRHLRDSRSVYMLIAACCAFFFVVRSVQWLSVMRKLPSAMPLALVQHPLSPALQTDLVALAEKSGISRMLHVSVKDGDETPEIEFEWEASEVATLRFLSLAESQGMIDGCRSLLLGVESTAKKDLHGQAICRPGTKPPKTARFSDIPESNAFGETAARGEPRRHPLPQKMSPSARPMTPASPSPDGSAQKRQELQTQWVVTGIANNGRGPVAVIEVRGVETKSQMAKPGDDILGARVVSIDETSGEVHLNYEGQFDVVLKLKSGQGY